MLGIEYIISNVSYLVVIIVSRRHIIHYLLSVSLNDFSVMLWCGKKI